MLHASRACDVLGGALEVLVLPASRDRLCNAHTEPRARREAVTAVCRGACVLRGLPEPAARVRGHLHGEAGQLGQGLRALRRSLQLGGLVS